MQGGICMDKKEKFVLGQANHKIHKFYIPQKLPHTV